MKKIFTLVSLTVTTCLLFTAVASAQGVTSTGVQQGMGTFAGLINTFNSTIVKALGTLLLSGAVVAFFFGVAQFIWGMRSGKPDVLTNGKQFMIWALIGLFVMFSVYGIIKFAQGIVPGLDSGTITIPNVQYGSGGGSAAGTGGIGSSGSGSGSGSGYTCPDGFTVFPSSADAARCPVKQICPDGTTFYASTQPNFVCPDLGGNVPRGAN